MSTWTLLLLASALLVMPGLAISGVNPEFEDVLLAPPCDGASCKDQAQRCLQDGVERQRVNISITCGPCKRIMNKLLDMVGANPTQDSISQAETRVCDKVGMLKGLCKKIMGSFMRRVAFDITSGKSPRDICVDIRMCRPKEDLH